MNQRFVTRPTHEPADPRRATGEPLRWGVVATGAIARKVTAQLRQLEDARLQAVSSRSPERAAGFAEAFGFATSYGDDTERRGYEALAADPDVDVVYVTTPHGQHHEVTRALLLAGKHVLVEKSMTINAREAQELAAIARERGLFLMEAVWTRFLPAYQRVLDVLEAGEIGEVAYVQADLGFVAEHDTRTRLWEPAAGGGALLDLAVYPFSWVLGALGFPDTLSASGKLNADGVDELASLALGYATGAQAQLMVTFVSKSVGRAHIVGTEGFIETEASLVNPGGFTVDLGNVRRHERFTELAPPYCYQLREVTRCVQQGLSESATMPLGTSVRTMRLFDEVRRQLGVVYPNDRDVVGRPPS